MANVRFDGVSKVFDNGFRAVNDFTLDVPDGEFLVLVGPSGCGKTTVLRIVAGLENATTGTISIGDRVVNDVLPKDRDIAMVFQSYALYPHMSVRDNIGYGLRLRRMPKPEIAQRVERAAAMLSLTELLDRKPRQLSGGQRQRVAMGRAIVREPRLFLMDEPLSNLDAKLRVQMRSEIAQLQHQLGTTTIYVTHDQIEAMTMGRRVAVMRKGELLQIDTPQGLYEQPETLFVAGFIGSPPMNMVQGAVGNGDQLTIRLGEQSLPIPPDRLAALPALRAFAGRQVALGIRPEDIREPTGESDARLDVTVRLTEALGSHVVVHFDLAAPPVQTEHTAELAADRGTDELGRLHPEGDVTPCVASFGPRTHVRPGERIAVELDMCRAHFFDLDSGRAIRA